VESGNLQSISLSSGLDGNPQATGNIGGSLDLRLRKAGFAGAPLRINLSAGHEWNGHVQVYGADAAVSTHSFYANLGAFYRHANDYTVGGGGRLPYSQFSKVNAFANLGARLAKADVLEATVIFDRATDVGYPALNMDVAKAEAIITSLSHRHLFDGHSVLDAWETKAYYNRIIHTMDDTHRPEVEIHMDMPGKSQTAGLYSLLTGSLRSHQWQANFDLYYNRLFADMTMYPGGAAPMYMVTWPDVGTLNTGLSLTDNIRLSARHRLRLSAKVAWQQQRLNSDEGYNALKVFFPTMTDGYHQLTARASARYTYRAESCELGIAAGWGSRAPTVTEAYGYYLNNTFDRYDYMGNPSLSNESAVELNAALQFSASQSLRFKAQGNAFFFHNYIIGQFETRLSPMTVGAEGVKVYGNLPHATMTNLSFTADWQPLKWFSWQAGAAYAAGRDADGDPLPLIAPLAWHNTLSLRLQPFTLHLTIKGNARQRDYGAKYGESETAGWTVCNASAEWAATDRLTVRAGVENIFDKHYSSYADWNGIPQKGRNIYLNFTFEW
jgi:iron complex outermembrane receptor protein